MRLVVLAAVLSLPLVAHAALVPGTAHPVTAPVPDVASFSQTDARIATDGDAFLAVWIDRTFAGQGDVHGTRVSAEGKRIGDSVLAIATSAADEQRVAIAFGGDRYLVAWTTPSAVQGRFIHRDGTMSNPFVIAATRALNQIQVAFVGSRALVVFDKQFEFRGVLIDESGAVVRSFAIAPTENTLTSFALVSANGAFHLATSVRDLHSRFSHHDIGLTSIDAEGNVGARVVVAPATAIVADLNIATDGDDLLVGWSARTDRETVQYRRVTTAGFGPIQTIPLEQASRLYDLVADSGDFIVFYGRRPFTQNANAAVLMLRPGASEPFGTVTTPSLDPAILDSATNGQRTIAIARGGTMYPSIAPSGDDLYITRLDTMEMEPLVVTPRHQSSPDVAAAGDARLAVWCEYIGAERRLGIVGQRLDTSGNALVDGGIDLLANLRYPAAPRVTSNGTDFLVTWRNDTTIEGMRVAHDGTLLDAEPFVISAKAFEGTEVAVAWNGERYVVVYFQGTAWQGLKTLAHVALIPSAGSDLQTDIALHGDVGPNELIAIASDGNDALIVWRNVSSELRGVLLSRSGSVTPIAIPTMQHPQRPALAWNGSTYLLATPILQLRNNRIELLRVSAAGTVTAAETPSIGVSTAAGTMTVDLEPFGNGFFLFMHGVTPNENIYGGRLDVEGALIDSLTVVGSTPLEALTPTFGAAGNVFVYPRLIGHPTRDITRVFARSVTPVEGTPRRRAAGR